MDMIATYHNHPYKYLLSDNPSGFDLVNKRKVIGTTAIETIVREYGQYITVFYQEGMVGWK